MSHCQANCACSAKELEGFCGFSLKISIWLSKWDLARRCPVKTCHACRGKV